MRAPIEFWFDFASTYSYLAAMRIEELAAEGQRSVIWRPFLLGPLFTAQLGLRDSPYNANPVRGRYMWRDLERLCEGYGFSWRKPSQFPRNSVRAARVACLGASGPWAPAFIRSVFLANFTRDLDIGSDEVLLRILDDQGLDGEALLARSDAPETKQLLRANTEEAAQRGLFGAPSFFVSSELFFGNDRLEDALAWEPPAALQ